MGWLPLWPQQFIPAQCHHLHYQHHQFLEIKPLDFPPKSSIWVVAFQCVHVSCGQEIPLLETNSVACSFQLIILDDPHCNCHADCQFKLHHPLSGLNKLTGLHIWYTSSTWVYHHHHHHNHQSVMELGHLLTHSGLTYPEVSSMVCHDSFCQLDNSVSLMGI
jgi:hypothetical protein